MYGRQRRGSENGQPIIIEVPWRTSSLPLAVVWVIGVYVGFYFYFFIFLRDGNGNSIRTERQMSKEASDATGAT